MAPALPRLVPMVELVRRAAVYPCGILGASTYQSYPLPVAGAARLQVAFLFGEAAVVEPGSPLQLGVPQYVGLLDAESGRFMELRGLSPEEGGGPDGPSGWLGPGRTRQERAEPEYLSQELRVLQALDELAPAFAAGGLEPPEAARNEFASLFPRVSEAPLRPYYAALGARFFAWLRGRGAGARGS
jgi:hypothetical protein